MTTARDIEAIGRASNWVKHGTTFLGGSFADCICPKQKCGGVSGDEEAPHCPEHREAPTQMWHWAAECPGAAGG